MRVSLLLCALLTAGCATHPPAPQETQRATAQSHRPTPTASIGERLTAQALKMVGTPYRYGGASPAGFDCSGLVYWSYGRLGIRVPRTSSEQRRAARAIDPRALEIGDLLFFDTDSKTGHVGIYVGARRFVHAPTSGGHVSVVAMDSGYYRGRLIAAGRLHY